MWLAKAFMQIRWLPRPSKRRRRRANSLISVSSAVALGRCHNLFQSDGQFVRQHSDRLNRSCRYDSMSWTSIAGASGFSNSLCPAVLFSARYNGSSMVMLMVRILAPILHNLPAPGRRQPLRIGARTAVEPPSQQERLAERVPMGKVSLIRTHLEILCFTGRNACAWSFYIFSGRERAWWGGPRAAPLGRSRPPGRLLNPAHVPL